MATEENTGTRGLWDFDSTLMSRNFKFVEKLGAQYMCPSCGQVVLNPHQTGCGHIFCYQCIRDFLESSKTPKCPIDYSVIKPNEVFQDNCCKREILNLEIYCTNSPHCTYKVAVCRLQDHLKTCRYERVPCSNSGCDDVVFRKDLRDHLWRECVRRLEPCPHCRRFVMLTQLKEHETTMCPDVQIPCPTHCLKMIKRHELKQHYHQCPEVETDCMYKKYGCSFRDRRIKVQGLEDDALNDHLLLVLESNTRREKQIDGLQQSLELKHHEFQERISFVNNLERVTKPLVQQVTRSDHVICTVQKSLEEQQARVSTVGQQIQRLTCALGQESAHTELAQLRGSLDSLRQQVSVIEGLNERLGLLEHSYLQHSRLLSIHADQLQRNELRFQELESTSYNGKLIWKILDYQGRRQAASEGHATLLSSPPFYSGRSGYKLSACAYLNGDGSGLGTHLSLYIVVMKGDFDSLLPWPFQQSVTLAVLDQSGFRKDVTGVFKPDPTSNSFRRPVSEMNVASGFPCFISHTDLEAPQGAVFVKDDTLFIKVKVDPSGLEDN